MPEPRLRYGVMRRATKLPAEYGAPAWELLWSFFNEQAAEEALADYREDSDLYEYKIDDNQPKFRERDYAYPNGYVFSGDDR